MNSIDALDILFGDCEVTAEDEAEYAAEAKEAAQNVWTRARNFRPELRAYSETLEVAELEMIEQLAKLNAEKALWIAKTYKENSKTIKFGDIDDDRDDRVAAYSITSINAKRRTRNIENLSKSIDAVLVALGYANKDLAEIAKITYFKK
jgi:hypothetical protein